MIALVIAIAAIAVFAKRRSLKKYMPFLGKTDTVFSITLNEKRKLWLHLPKDGGGGPYPSVYLLDAEGHFRQFRAMLRRVKLEDGSRLFPDMIVVGIVNSDRSRDLTPSHSMRDNFGKQERTFRSSGGGARFIEFLEKELIPHIESKFPVAVGKRIIGGHSLGGLTAVNILLNHGDLFAGYLASDPSMWWDDQMILKQADIQLKAKNFDDKSLFIGIANTAPPGAQTDQSLLDDSVGGHHLRSIFQLVRMAEGNEGNGLRLGYKYYENESHNSIPSKAIYDGMRFLLGL